MNRKNSKTYHILFFIFLMIFLCLLSSPAWAIERDTLILKARQTSWKGNYDEAIAIRDIPDGTSATLIVSEDSNWPDGQWINGRNIFDQAFPINKAPRFENDIRSRHPLGANALFCDGSATFLSQDMDLLVLAAICTRHGGETTANLIR